MDRGRAATKMNEMISAFAFGLLLVVLVLIGVVFAQIVGQGP